jgi:hypothetical protein
LFWLKEFWRVEKECFVGEMPVNIHLGRREEGGGRFSHESGLPSPGQWDTLRPAPQWATGFPTGGASVLGGRLAMARLSATQSRNAFRRARSFEPVVARPSPSG